MGCAAVSGDGGGDGALDPSARGFERAAIVEATPITFESDEVGAVPPS